MPADPCANAKSASRLQRASGDPERASRPREQQALYEQLPDDGQASRAQRCADGDLAAARCCPGQKIGDIEAVDRQHDADGGVQDQQRSKWALEKRWEDDNYSMIRMLASCLPFLGV